MKLLKLNEKGVAHYLVAAVAVLAIAAVGTYVMTQTHAQAPPATVSTQSSAQSPKQWTLIASSPENINNIPQTYSFYACKTANSANTQWNVKTEVTSSVSVKHNGNYYWAGTVYDRSTSNSYSSEYLAKSASESDWSNKTLDLNLTAPYSGSNYLELWLGNVDHSINMPSAANYNLAQVGSCQ